MPIPNAAFMRRYYFMQVSDIFTSGSWWIDKGIPIRRLVKSSDMGTKMILGSFPLVTMATETAISGMDSTSISVRVHSLSHFLAGLEVRHILGRHLHLDTRLGISRLAWRLVI